MKMKYLLFAMLACAGVFLTGCVHMGASSSHIKTPEGSAQNVDFYLDFFGRGHPVYPPSIAAESVPVAYARSYPAYGGGTVGVYSGGYYGRPVSNIDYGPHYRHDDYPDRRDDHRHLDPPHAPRQTGPIYFEGPPRPRIQPPSVLPPTGSTTVVTPTYRTPVLPNYGPYRPGPL